MVTRLKSFNRNSGWLMIELQAAISLLIAALLPLAYSLASEKKLARSQYQRAVAMEIVDGEFEALLAGERHAFTPGTHKYQVRAAAATNLPPGQFVLTLDQNHLRLEWKPDVKHQGGTVVREVKLQ